MRVQNHKDQVIQDLFELKAQVQPAYKLNITAIGPVVSVFLKDEAPILVVDLNYDDNTNNDFDDAYKLIMSKVKIHKVLNDSQTEQGSSLLPVVYSPSNQFGQLVGAA